MIVFDSQIDFQLENEQDIKTWIESIVVSEGFKLGDILYIFCDDDFLHDINVKFLNHDTLTDIITFDYNLGKQINSEIYISIPRVKENAQSFKTTFENELHRVIIHGILHLCGYKDETDSQQTEMRLKEDSALRKLILST
ncbi:MAG TPA: rRNA maturation RNase YbeY [Aequorivita sp.]|nr:rRNA maturation RNase YbeY [Aequorivita sp.]